MLHLAVDNYYEKNVLSDKGLGTWIRPGSTGICSSLPDPKG